MKQMQMIWAKLTLQRRIMVGLASVVMFAAVLGIARMAAAPNLTLLYAGLESQAAGDIVQALEQQAVGYEVRGDAIYVDATARDSLRLTLASQGMPRASAQGYELLDTLTGFGTTSQMFDAAYWRAKEGELARTVLASPTITAARVHIANTPDAPFQRNARSTASVTLTTSNGGVSRAQAQAIRYLVASAVATLEPADVAVIDSATGLIGGTDTDRPLSPGLELSEKMRERILRLLEARVGPSNAMVEVNVETELESESIRERRIDPESRVAISSETEEASTESSGPPAGEVTVASNLPDGDAQAGGASTSANNQTRERINYEVSETSREVLRAPGTIKRMTIAVLVNTVSVPDQAEGSEGAARPDEELLALRDLVASVAGFDESRGDQITIKSMTFSQPVSQGTLANETLFDLKSLDLMSILQLAVLSLLTLVMGLFVLRPILTSAVKADPEAATSQMAAPLLGNLQSIPALTGEISENGQDFADLPLSFPMAQPDVLADQLDPVDRLKSLIAQRQDETVEILRGWLEDRGARAR